MILDKINLPEDIKSLTIKELEQTAEEIRSLIIKKVNTIGGHMGPNLGIVETTLALHYVFNSPKDKFIFDVSHQCYPHKIITGRKDAFTNPDEYFKYTGYTAPEESEHDLFKVGHTSTSVSLATGVAKARDLQQKKYNVIALIGDGSLSGGEAFEGLNNAAELNSNIIIVVNDNDMSIAENSGGLYKNLKLLRDTDGQAECNFFKALGFEYYYEKDGNNLEKMITIFEKVKDTNKPTVVHINTIKGLGLEPAIKNKEKFHYIMPNLLDENNKERIFTPNNTETYDDITKDFILKKAKENPTTIAISPATPGACGFDKEFRKKLGAQYCDVGIAEEHAIAYASALAKNGAIPILAILSSFVQRTYDQLSQDLCLNHSPITMLVYWGMISGADATHLGTFDIPLIINIPNMVYLAPTCKEEYLAMLEWAHEQKEHPVAIRVPFGQTKTSGIKDTTNYSLLNKYKVEHKGEKIAIIALGSFFDLGKQVSMQIKKEKNIDSTLINPRFISGTDKDLLERLKSNHKLVITIEDGCLDGGFGEKISRFYSDSNMKVLNYGSFKEFSDRCPLDELYKKYRLTPELILEDINKLI